MSLVEGCNPSPTEPTSQHLSVRAISISAETRKVSFAEENTNSYGLWNKEVLRIRGGANLIALALRIITT